MTIRIPKRTLKVLIIEDSIDDAQFIIMELGKTYKVIWQIVKSEASLIVALDDEWDIVTCDYKMPSFSAENAIKIIREHPVSFMLPIIILSGYADETIALELLKKGASDFVSKDKIMRLQLVVEREINDVKEKKDSIIRTNMKVQESYDQTIMAWGKALELRDYYTKGHTQRVTDLSLRLAAFMNVPHNDFVTINRGALLHDIGKMAMPDSILLKEGPLTFEEMEIMKMHTKLAKEMLEGISFLKAAMDIPYYHHEKWNGSGYPLGLVGEQIPFIARLFSVIDVYDALTNDRPYRKSWDKAKAIAYLLDEKEISFDSNIVDAFVDMMGRG